MLSVPAALKVTSYAVTAAIIADPSTSQSLGLWAVFATSLAGVITNWINRRADRAEAQQRHEWDKEDRAEKAAQVKADLEEAKREVVVRTDKLQAAVETTGTKADLAYEAANHVNEKIAAITRGPVAQGIALESDTNATVHRIDAKVLDLQQ